MEIIGKKRLNFCMSEMYLGHCQSVMENFGENSLRISSVDNLLEKRPIIEV